MIRHFVTALGLLAASAASFSLAAPATMTVRVDQPGHAVPASLYGVFFEEINRAGDGGLYAEMIENRSFEDGDTPLAWDVSKDAEASVEQTMPLNDRNRRSLRIKSSKPVRLVNDGFKGMHVGRGAEYVASFYARGALAKAKVRLETADGKQLATSPATEISGGEWKRYVCPLKATGDDAAARFVLEVNSPGPIWLDMISLLPKQSWKDRGLRVDLAEKLEALRPDFVRFPGGCWVEGETIANAYRWKQTIGPIEQRRNQYNLWKYQSTHGLGYHEYLQLCEDLEADALFVINCGMAHKGVVPMDKMSEWVQDALDAIEYANGPADSKWGAERTKNGHPKPFNLKYLQIGNENGGPRYDERYALFYDAIKAKYPDMKIVANLWQGRPGSRPIEILDEHYYNAPGFFIANADRYDSYDRSGPKIYVGEYAVTRDCGTGNLKAAVAEAAFMTGIERNSDIVVMASYAPLFANVHYKGWNPNAINFDASRSYGTPSYYVQKLFATNRPDVVLPVELPSFPPPPPPTGAVGVGTWLTQAEFKDATITRGGKTQKIADFDPLRGEWKPQENGAIAQTGNAEGCVTLAAESGGGDCVFSVKARKTGGAEGFLILVHASNERDFTWWNLGGWGNRRHGIEQSIDGAKSLLGSDTAGRIETGRWYDIRVELEGNRIRCYLDDKLVHDVQYPAPRPLYATAGKRGNDEVIVKVANVSAQPQEVDVRFTGVGNLGKGTGVVLTSSSPEDENSLDRPTHVAPVESELKTQGSTLRHTFAPHSVTVLRVKGNS